jgi:hypothetical protein
VGNQFHLRSVGTQGKLEMTLVFQKGTHLQLVEVDRLWATSESSRAETREEWDGACVRGHTQADRNRKTH